MRRDLMLKAAETVLPPLDFPRASGAAPVRARESGGGTTPNTKTTIVAFHYRDGLMCAADRKVSGFWYHIHSQEMVKMWRVSANAILLGCGNVGHVQLVCDLLRRRCTTFHKSYGENISVDGQAKIVARCALFGAMNLPDFSFGALLAGRNRDGQSHIFSVEEDGSRLKSDRYEAMGSGGANAQVALDKGWAPDLDLAAARTLAVDAIFHAANRDSGSSPIQVALPTLATVTKEGVTKVTDETVMETVAQVLRTKLGIQATLARAIVRNRRRKS